MLVHKSRISLRCETIMQTSHAVPHPWRCERLLDPLLLENHLVVGRETTEEASLSEEEDAVVVVVESSVSRLPTKTVPESVSHW
jgi:hypothetical protein